MSPEDADRIAGQIREVLVSTTGAIHFESVAGLTEIENWQTGWMEHAYNGTRTITIKINGGARDERTVKR